jgi:hypothetical protein
MASIKVTREVNQRGEVNYWVYRDEKVEMCYPVGILHSDDLARQKALIFASLLKSNPLQASVEIIAEY